MTKTIAEYFAPVLAWLDAGAPHTKVGRNNIGFSMKYFVLSGGQKDFAGQDCGTVCCVAGAVDIFNKTKLEYIGDVGDLLGMTWQDADEMFFAYRYCNDHDGVFRNITPDHAARTIRHYLETGVVDWKGNEVVPANEAEVTA